MPMSRWIGVLALSLAVACADDTPEDAEEEIYDSEAPPAEVVPPDTGVAATYAPELEVDLAQFQRTPSGLYVQEVAAGEGPDAAAGSTAVVHYTGWFPDGREFDSSRGRNEPLPFPLGAGQVIAGWEEGVAGMKVGGRRKLVVPPNLAYGPAGYAGVIPPNATLVFDIELLEIR